VAGGGLASGLVAACSVMRRAPRLGTLTVMNLRRPGLVLGAGTLTLRADTGQRGSALAGYVSRRARRDTGG
jgi:hypothetical protein